MASKRKTKGTRASSGDGGSGRKKSTPYRFSHLKKVNIRNVFVHSLKTQ